MEHRTLSASAGLIIAAAALAFCYPWSNFLSPHKDAPGIIERENDGINYDPIQFSDPASVLQRLAGTLKFETISDTAAHNHAKYPKEFKGLHKHLRQSFPLIYRKLEVREVNELSLLFKWQGYDPSLKPILCISHMDVVAVGSESKWTHPPFSGAISEGFVWGRGALDLKFSVAALLEAASYMLAQGAKPARTVYFAFGHDEEVGGGFGASAMAELLEKEGIDFEHILDEGGTVLTDGLKGIMDTPVAVVGTAEKAIQTMEIEVHGKGGHSMAPPHDGSSVAARLSRLINNVETNFPPPRLLPPTSELLKTLSRVTRIPALGMLLRHCDKWPLSWLLAQALAKKDPELGSALRTTGVTTDIQLFPPGRNVVPSMAKAFISYRLSPHDSPARIKRQLESFARQESQAGQIKISAVEHVRPSPVSSVDSLGFQFIRIAAQETLTGPDGLAVAPYLMLGRTDSTNYIHLSGGNIFRFTGFTMNRTAGDLQRVHGIDERIGTDTYLNGVRFYIRYLQLATSPL